MSEVPILVDQNIDVVTRPVARSESRLKLPNFYKYGRFAYCSFDQINLFVSTYLYLRDLFARRVSYIFIYPSWQILAGHNCICNIIQLSPHRSWTLIEQDVKKTCTFLWTAEVCLRQIFRLKCFRQSISGDKIFLLFIADNIFITLSKP